MYLAATGILSLFGTLLCVTGFVLSKADRELLIALAVPGVAALMATTARIVIGMRVRSEPLAYRMVAAIDFMLCGAWFIFMVSTGRARSATAGIYVATVFAFFASSTGALLASFFALGRAGQKPLKTVTLLTCACVGVATLLATSLGAKAWYFAQN
jgi:hypothetical protein